MATISANNIKVAADTSGVITGMAAAQKAIRGFTLDINAKVVDAYKRASKEQSVFRGGLKQIGDDLQNVSKRLGLFGGLPVIFGGAKAYKEFGEIQKLEKGLQQYGERLEDIKELAKLPNVSIEGAASSIIGLRAAGIESEKSARLVRGFANALTAAGKSSSDLQPTLANVVQMMGNGMISAADVKEMANRAPQIRKILLDTFGTTSGEALSKIGVEKVIDGLLTGLEKIPQVSGGASMAMEQFGDSVQFSMASIGEMLDKAFDVTGIIQGLGNALDNVTDHFRALSPEAQKSILAVGAAAVVVPTVVGAIGGLVKLLPLVATGFGLISAPVAAVVAGVGLATAVIITNWEKIKQVLGDAGVWTNIIGVAKPVLNLLVETVKVVLNLIQGDWANFGTALVNVMKNAWNGVVNIVAGGIKAVLGMLGGLTDLLLFGDTFKSLGMGALSDTIKGLFPSIDKLRDKLAFEVPDATDKVVAGFQGWTKLSGVTSLITDNTKKLGAATNDAADSTEKLTKAQYELWKIDLATKHLKDAQALKQANEEAKKVLGSAITGMDAGPIQRGVITDNTRDIRLSLKKINIQKPDIIVPDENFLAELEKADFFGKTGLSMNISKFISFDSREFLRGIDIEAIRATFAAIPATVSESVDQYGHRIDDFIQKNAELSKSISGALQGAAASAVEGVGELVGNLMSGVDGLQDFGKKVVGTLADLAKSMGKSLIAFGTSGIALKVFMKNPYTAIIAGAALIALSTAMKNSISDKVGQASQTRFAKGGFAYGEMQAIVGDNPGARFDPEMIAPYSKVDQSIGKSIEKHGSAGNIHVEITSRIRGQDIELVVDRVRKSNSALRGRRG